MDLKALGLTKYEKEVYISLLKNGKSSAQEISEKSGVPQTAVYPNLKGLIKKKLIQRLEGKTSLFQAFPIRKALSAYAEEKKKEIEKLKEEAIEFYHSLNPDKKEVKQAITLSYGKEFSKETYLDAIGRCRRTFYVLGWRFERVGDKYNLIKNLKKIIKSKVDVRIIITGSGNKQEELIEAYREIGVKVKYLPLDNFSIFISDSEECKLTIKHHGEERVNVNIVDKDLASAMQSYFLESWDKAEKI